jgi:hypothetical protein
MGYAAAAWFEKGEKLSGETMKAITKNLTLSIVTALRGIGKKKPGKDVLQAKITEALEGSGMAENPQNMTGEQAAIRTDEKETEKLVGLYTGRFPISCFSFNLGLILSL